MTAFTYNLVFAKLVFTNSSFWKETFKDKKVNKNVLAIVIKKLYSEIS